MTTLADLNGSTWSGDAELWTDPLGDVVQRSDCTLEIDGRTVRYTWSQDGRAQAGSVVVHDDGAEFTDTWHQPEPMRCTSVAGARGLFQVMGAYGPEEEWGWRIGLFHRTPTDQLVLQMTNIAPWGEEVRAVRMTGSRVP